MSWGCCKLVRAVCMCVQGTACKVQIGVAEESGGGGKWGFSLTHGFRGAWEGSVQPSLGTGTGQLAAGRCHRAGV